MMLKMSNLTRVLFSSKLRVRSLERLCSVFVEPVDRVPLVADPVPLDSETILNSVKFPLKNSTLCGYIVSLSKLYTEDKQINELKKDERFSQLIKLLEEDVRNCRPVTLIGSLKALESLGMPSDSYVVKNLENSVMWTTRACSIKDLVQGFSFSVQRQETDSQKIVFAAMIASIERRWVEIKDGKLFATLLLHGGKLLSPQLMGKLEDRIQDSIEEMTPADMVQILECYGKTGRRSMPVIRSLGFHISKNRTLLNIKQIADVLFAFNKLSFKDQDTLERICSSLEPMLENNEKPAVVRSILTSLGQLKLSSTVVLDMICDWYDKRVTDGKPVESRDISCLLLTLANLNYSPFDKAEFFQKLVGRLDKADVLTLPRGELLWVDIVWSLVVLNKATAEHFSSVLDPSFFNKLIESEETKYSAVKILNINGAAQLLHKDYKGPTINVAEYTHLTDLHPTASSQKTKFKTFVLETLSTLFPPPRFVSEDVKTGLGLILDAEVIVDSNAKPLQVDQYSCKFGEDKPPKRLPNGAHRIALFVTPFQESLIGGGMTGSSSLCLRLAEASGYTPLVIDHRTIDASMKIVSRVQKLDVLVKQAIGRKRT